MCKMFISLNPTQLADVSITFESNRGEPFWGDETPTGQRTDQAMPRDLVIYVISLVVGDALHSFNLNAHCALHGRVCYQLLPE